MTTLNSTSILASIIAQNPYHIISIQGQMPMSHAENTYDFEIAEDDPHYDDMVNYSADMLWVYTYADKESKNQVYIPHQDKWNEHCPTPGKPNPNYYTDSGATFNKHLRTQNKLKSK